ncbi:MAG TPA: lipase family protein [Mycobacterium sp.]
MIRTKTAAVLACVLTASTVALAACGNDPAPTAPQTVAESGMKLDADYSGAGQVPGALISASVLPTVDRRLRSSTSLAARVEYTSTSGITDGHTPVSGTVFVPKGKPPQGGWPILAYGHGTTGVAPDCGPSLSQTLLGSSLIIQALVNEGYLVTMPDYQGLGMEGTYHPYLDSTTAGYNMIDAVRAARKLVPAASNKWVALGLSQGGQAAWAANELNANYGSDLDLRGSVSLSPPTDLTDFATEAAAGTLNKDQRPALQLILHSLKNAYSDFNLDDYRRGIVESKWDVLSACQGPLVSERKAVTSQISADDLRPSSPEAVAMLKGYLQKMSLPQGPTAAPMLVIYGDKDSLLPVAWTDRAVEAACQMGDVIEIEAQRGKDHGDIDQSRAFPWIQERFAGAPPAQNNCATFVPGAEQSESGDDTSTEPTSAQLESVRGDGS